MTEHYSAFLLRLKRNSKSGRWQATIENVHTGESIKFANEIQLLAYLANHLDISTLSGIDSSLTSTAPDTAYL